MELLRQGPRARAERAVVSEFDLLKQQQFRATTIKSLVQAAMIDREHSRPEAVASLSVESDQHVERPPAANKTREEREEPISLQLVIVPCGAEVHYCLNEEPIQDSMLRDGLMPGRHTLDVIPDTLEWGVRRIRLRLAAGAAPRVVIRLRRLHVRSLTSCLSVVAYGMLLGAGLYLLPFSPWRAHSGRDGQLWLWLYGVFLGIPTALLLTYPVRPICWLLRGLILPLFPHPTLEYRENVLGGLVGVLPVLGFYVAYLCAISVRPGLCFGIWAMLQFSILGVLLCLVPWRNQYARRP